MTEFEQRKELTIEAVITKLEALDAAGELEGLKKVLITMAQKGSIVANAAHLISKPLNEVLITMHPFLEALGKLTIEHGDKLEVLRGKVEVLSKLNDEMGYLDDKIEKLKSFLSNESNFDVVGEKQWNLMRDQIMAMNAYRDTLEKRFDGVVGLVLST
jgi:hypothetical protein